MTIPHWKFGLTFYPVRYADDFLIFVAGGYDDAAAERRALADWLREEMGLTLSEEKTRITELTEGFRFLGCRVRLKWDDRYGYGCRIEIPKEVVNDFRWRIKKVLRRQTQVRSLESMLREINPILRGWSGYYRYCIGAKRILSTLDWYASYRLWLWLRGKHNPSWHFSAACVPYWFDSTRYFSRSIPTWPHIL